MSLSLSLTKLTACFLLLLLGTIGTLSLSSRLFKRYARSQEVENPFVGLILIALGIFAFLLLWFGFSFEDTPIHFMQALHDGDKATAFNLLTPELQDEMGGLDGFAIWADDWHPADWIFWNGCNTFRLARSDGTGHYPNQQGFSVSFHMRHTEGAWRIQGIEFGSPGPSFRAGSLSRLECLAD